MIDTNTRQTAQNPSGFGMSMSGAAFGTGIAVTTIAPVCAAPTYVVRDRHVAGIAVLPQDFRPGSTAWSPPTC